MAEVLAAVLPNTKPGAKSADPGFKEGLLGMMWLKLDDDPTSSDTPAPIGSLASYDDGAGTGTLYFKFGPDDGDWKLVTLTP